MSAFPIRYFHCGEYGELLKRPHYHAILFGVDFADKKLWKQSAAGPLFRSEILEKLWPFGFSSIGAVTFESACYVARYCVKKVSGKKAVRHYESVDRETGVITRLLPEYVTMSLKPGIGHDWFKCFSSDVFPSDEVIVNAKAAKPPRYYEKLHTVVDAAVMEGIKARRLAKADARFDDNSPARLRVKREVAQARLNLKRRSLDALGNDGGV